MAEITKKRVGELLMGVFRVLIEADEPLRAGEVLNRLRKEVPPTPFELSEYDSGGQRYDKIVRFSTIDCVKAGWLLKEKGKWSLSEEGVNALQSHSDPAEFYSRARQLYNKWASNRAKDESEEIEDELEENEKEVTITIEKAEELAWKEIEDHLKAIDPYEFQDMVAALLSAMGYHISWVAAKGKDRGIDILAWSDPLGTKPPRIKVQVKRYDSNIPVDTVRSFMAVLGDDDVGIFVTTSDFTKDAAEEARLQEKRKITLIGLNEFVGLWIKYYNSIEEGMRRKFPLQPIYFLSPKS